MINNIIDITIPLTGDLPKWPGSPGFIIQKFQKMENGNQCNNSLITCDVHFGTHIDAPLHFFQDGKSIDQIDLESLIGEVYVANLPDIDDITKDILELLPLNKGIKRIIFRTKNSELWSKRKCVFYPDYVALSPDGAKWLVDKGIKLVGTDYLSIQPFNDKTGVVHKILLGNGVTIIEGLNMFDIAEGIYELICLPLNIVGADGAPARVILKKV